MNINYMKGDTVVQWLALGEGLVSGFSSILSKSKGIFSQMSKGVNSGLTLFCPAMSWRLFQGVSTLSHYDRWERLFLTPVTLSSVTSAHRKQMDAFVSSLH